MEVGIIRSWFEDRGFGFIKPSTEGADDVFLHSSVLKACGLQAQSRGARIEFEAQRSSRGLRAVRVRQPSTT